MARLRKIWVLISLAGTVLTVVGIVGLVAHWGSTHATASTVATPRAASATASATASSTASATASATAITQAESPSAFFALFAAAVRSGDTAFLASRVDPVVVSRYGAAQCQSAVRSLSDPTERLHLVSADGPIQYVYATDGLSSTVGDTFVFHVDGTATGRSGPRDYHFALDGGTFHLFLDCGTPPHS